MEQQAIPWQAPALIGLAFYALGRWAATKPDPEDLQGYGVWAPPPWVLLILGGKEGLIQLSIAAIELMSLIWLVMGTIGWLTQPPPRSTASALLGGPIVVSMPVLFAIMILVEIRRWRGR